MAFAVLLGFLLTLVQLQVQGERPCAFQSNGNATHYFSDYDLKTYNVSCGEMCLLPTPANLLEVVMVHVYFGENDIQADCSWLLRPNRTLNSSVSTVMLFEQNEDSTITHGIVCNESSTSLTLQDQAQVNGQDTTPYDICKYRNEDKDRYIRRSSQLGNVDTVISLQNYNVVAGANMTVLKYLLVDWSEDCSQDSYMDIPVASTLNFTRLGSKWLTSNLRFPNGMHCRWKLTAPSNTNHLIRLRVTVTKNAAIPDSCVQDDYVQIKDSLQSQVSSRASLCDDSDPYFYSTSSDLVYLDFMSGPTLGAPEFELAYSTLDPCPQSRLTVNANDGEEALYIVPQAGQSGQTCSWKVSTSWPNDIIMFTRIERVNYQQECTQDDYLNFDLGSVRRQRSLCQDIPTPIWSNTRDVDLMFSRRQGSSRRVVVYYKNVRKVPACQGIPVQLPGDYRRKKTLLIEMTQHREFLHVSAPDCRWHVVASSDMTSTEDTVAELVITNTGSGTGFPVMNTTTVTWMMSGFRAYPGDSINANASIRHDCQFTVNAVECKFTSTQSDLLLVYDPSLSTSPYLLDRLNLEYQQVKQVSSGQSGSSWRTTHGAQLASAVLFVWLKFFRVW